MRRTSVIAVVVAAAALVFTAGGCNKGSGKPGPAKRTGTIGLSVLTLTNPFFGDIAEHMRKAAAEHGYDLEPVSSDLDPAKQYKQVNDFIVKKVVAIVLTPADSKAVGEAIKMANEAGIPVFTADIACLVKDAKVVCHVATDNYQGGRLAGKAMMEALNNEGKVAVIDHPEVESVIQRTKGFKDELKEAGSPIEIVEQLAGGGDKSKSFKVTQDILLKHRDLDGIFAINDPSAIGAYQALRKVGMQDKVKIVGFDGMPEGKQAIKDGKIYADPMQSTEKIARGVIDAMVDYFEGKDVPPEILIPTELYRKADADKDPTLR